MLCPTRPGYTMLSVSFEDLRCIYFLNWLWWASGILSDSQNQRFWSLRKKAPVRRLGFVLSVLQAANVPTDSHGNGGS